jgi:hypothetical protein
MRDHFDTVEKKRNGAGGIFYVINGNAHSKPCPLENLARADSRHISSW